jgi:uncharacterized membrane protein HdeD (DUF308 family)
MIRKYFRVIFATVSLIIVLTLNYFFNLSNTTLTILFAIYLAFLWVYDIAKLKSEEKKNKE